MVSKIFWKWFFIFLLAWALLIWSWVLWPQPNETKEFTFPEISSPFLVSEEGKSFSILEGEMTAALSFPKVIHMGDTGIGGLRVQSTKESLEIEVNPSYHLIVETRLDLPLMEVTPDSGVEQTFDQTRPLNFQWTFFSNKSGKYEGQLWVYILIVNREGEIDRQAMLAVPIELDSHNFLGLSERILLWVSVLLVPTLLGVGLYYRKIE